MYRVVESKDKVFTITDSLTEKQFIELKQNNELISKINSNIKYIELLKEEYEEYISTIKDKKSKDTKIIRSINNFCGGYKSFIDRWETYFKRESSQELIDYFKLTVSEIYDRCFEYRFIYNLRNYAQHAGTPVSRITVSLEKESEIMIGKEAFIASHKGMQTKFKKELNRIQIDEINIHSAIMVVYKELQAMHEKFIKKIIQSTDGVIYSADYVRKFNQKYNKCAGELLIISQKSADEMIEKGLNSETTTFNPYFINHLLALEILKGAMFKFAFKGKCIGERNGFPMMYPTSHVLQMPKFHSGKEYVMYENVQWRRITKQIGLSWKDGYDRLFEAYMPMGLSMKVYNKANDSLKEEGKKLFKK